jgi:hypothetical protein
MRSGRRHQSRFVIITLSILSLLVGQGHAGWDKTKPPTSSSWQSVWFRDNWTAVETALRGRNLAADPTFLIWPGGDTVMPAHWLSSGGPTIARAGTGLGDTNRFHGPFSLKITSAAGTVAQAYQDGLAAASYDDGFDLSRWSIGARVKTAVASCVRVFLDNGGATAPIKYSSFHTGGGGWEWLTIPGALIESDATRLRFGMEVCAGTRVAYLSGISPIMGEIPPQDYVPVEPSMGTKKCFVAGNQTATNRKAGCDEFFERPVRIRYVFFGFTTAPLPGTSFVIRSNHFDGAAFQSMWATNPSGIAAAQGPFVGFATTYRYRCFYGMDTGSQTDRVMSVDVVTAGTGNPGADLTVWTVYDYFVRPLENYTQSGEFN